MKKGRIPQEEIERRLKVLLRFIFTFRYTTRKQLFKFGQEVMGLSNPRYLINHSLRNGFIKTCREPEFKTKVYYLTYKAKELLYGDESRTEHYYFEKTHTGLNTFVHHNVVVRVYFLLRDHIGFKEWVCESVLRMGRRRSEKIPDGQMILPDGTKVALEVETRPKKLSVLRSFIRRYRYEIEKQRCHCLLIIASSRLNYQGLRIRLLDLAPEFCSRKFIFADLQMLAEGMCFYQDKQRHLKEAVNLAKEITKNAERI